MQRSLRRRRRRRRFSHIGQKINIKNHFCHNLAERESGACNKRRVRRRHS